MTFKIKNLSLEVVLHHLIIALRPRLFSDSLCKKPVASLDELRRRAAKYMELEELDEFRKQLREEDAQKSTQENHTDRSRFSKQNQKLKNVPRGPRFE